MGNGALATLLEASDPAVGLHLPAELARFRTANQGVEVRLRQLGSVELIEGWRPARRMWLWSW